MATYTSLTRSQHLAVTSLMLGFLGIGFFWWTPLGMVMSLAGWVVACIGWVGTDMRTPEGRLLIAGMLLCAGALVLNLVIAGMGFELVRFHAVD